MALFPCPLNSPFSERTDVAFGGPGMMGVIWTRQAPLSHAVGEGSPSWLKMLKASEQSAPWLLAQEGSGRQAGL